MFNYSMLGAIYSQQTESYIDILVALFKKIFDFITTKQTTPTL